MYQKHLDYLIECVRNVEVEDGVLYLEGLAQSVNEDYVLTEVIQSFLYEVGERWDKSNTISLAECYISSKIVKEYLEKIHINGYQPSEMKVAVFGNILNDFQSSGRLLVIRFLEISGWTVYDLGNNVSPEQFIDEVKKRDAKFIGVSAMLYENALNIKTLADLVEESFDEGSKPYLVAGGAVFNVVPQLHTELNVLYTAKNAYEALKLFNELCEKEA